MVTFAARRLIRAEAKEIVRRLQLPRRDLTFVGLVAALQAYRCKPVDLQPMVHAQSRSKPAAVTGYLIDTSDESHVYFHPDDPAFYQLFVVLHELMHLAAGHGGCHVPVSVAQEGYAALQGEILATRARTPRRLTGAAKESHDFEELVAEEGAALLLSMLRRAPDFGSEAFA